MTNMVHATDDPLSTDAEPAPHPHGAPGRAPARRASRAPSQVAELTAAG